MRFPTSRLATAGAIACLAGALFCTHPAPAQVPGQDSFELKPIDFEVPPSIEAFDIGNNEFLVTFRWRPGFDARDPGVAGTFNGWNRGGTPMQGPDAEGFFTATIRIPEGEHRYKFVSGTDGWHTDPMNTDNLDGMGNSQLLLGLAARLADATAERGDGEIDIEAAGHFPGQYLFKDILSDTRAILRVRTLMNDAEGARIHFDGGATVVDMPFAGSDGLFDYYEHHYYGELWGDAPRAYSFSIHDGGVEMAVEGEWPLDLSAGPTIDTPEWARHAVWYQIMIDRFRDGDPKNNMEYLDDPGRPRVTHPWTSEWYTEQPWEREGGQTFWQWAMYNRLYGGDFQGVIDKLDYLKDLGITAIYFNPVFESHTAHKYNARTFVHADDGYGVAGSYRASMETHDAHDTSTWEWNPSDQMALRMIEEIHKRGMKVIFDGVWNHVGDDHHAFLDVRENLEDSRYAEWFDITSFDPFEYVGWAGFGGLPEFRKDSEGLASEKLEQHIWDVTERWMAPDGDPSRGIDGWRLDVPMHVPFPFWERWREHVKSINPEAYIVGEVWDPAEDWLRGDRHDAVMNYQVAIAAFPFFSNVNQKISASEFDRRLARLRLRYPANATYVLQNLFDSHDTDRWVSRIANPDLPYDAQNRIQDTGPDFFDGRPSDEHYQRLRLMAVFQATYVGAPMIYYGTEAGMFGADDPRNRMPMWWEDLMPYDDPDYIIMDDLRDHFRSLFQMRHGTEVLRIGEFRTAAAFDDQDSYAYYRWSPLHRDVVLVVLNNSGEEQALRLDAPTADILPRGFRNWTVLHGEGVRASTPDRGASIEVVLPPISGAVLNLQR